MINDEKIAELLNKAECRLEGLPKGFWRIIKLSQPEIWETPEDAEFEYVWIVAIMGKHCIFYDDLNKGFVIGHYQINGELSENLLGKSTFQLNKLIENIVNSRFLFR